MIDWQSLAVPPKPVPMMMIIMAKNMYKSPNQGSIEAFAEHLDYHDRVYFKLSTPRLRGTK